MDAESAAEQSKISLELAEERRLDDLEHAEAKEIYEEMFSHKFNEMFN